MLIIPAIDIKDGNCVRLLQGDPAKETVYSNSPLDMAREIERLGAEMIHVVDLDGAFSGRPVNSELIGTIARALSIPIEVGGGIRTAQDIELYLNEGIKRVVIGTMLIQDSFYPIIDKYRDSIIAGVDARDSKVATHGWGTITSIDALDFIKNLEQKGVGEVIYTDISTDGMLSGPNIDALKRILSNTDNISLIASGGVSGEQDIEALNAIRNERLRGCIIGKAFYDGKIDLAKALSR